MQRIEEVLNKINKLLSLSKGTTNINEAAAAAAAAQKLMDEYNIERATIDVLGNSPPENKESVEESEAMIKSGRVENWRYMLLNAIAATNSCRTLRRRMHRGETSLHLVGRRSNVQTVRYLFMYLTDEIENLARQRRGCGREWIASYKLGLMEGVKENLRKSHNDFMSERIKNVQSQGDSKAMVVLNKAVEMLKEEENELNKFMSQYATRKIFAKYSDGGALEQGRKDGRNIKISGGPALGAGSRRIEG